MRLLHRNQLSVNFEGSGGKENFDVNKAALCSAKL